MALLESGRLTVSGGQFDWGGHLNMGLVGSNAGGSIWLYAGTSVLYTR